MNNIINSILTIEEHARIRVTDAEKAAEEMISNARLESVKRIELIKQKAREQVELIDTQEKACADAIIESENVAHQERVAAMKSVFDENRQRISDEIFNAIIEGR